MPPYLFVSTRHLSWSGYATLDETPVRTVLYRLRVRAILVRLNTTRCRTSMDGMLGDWGYGVTVQPPSDRDTHFVDVSGIPMDQLLRLGDSALGLAIDRLAREVESPQDAVAGYSSAV
ncbi:FxSxx-COOH cyclophane-containing RiPP peptide [Actinocrispum sp. NPDC049592]|uniref:FxSxx-COOH cyclophane-containing RiPP peptide n=1 Tax=Actinocrispum sp. NPDC049592 TaxID=3154835 RepID=UPI00341F6637